MKPPRRTWRPPLGTPRWTPARRAAWQAGRPTGQTAATRRSRASTDTWPPTRRSTRRSVGDRQSERKTMMVFVFLNWIFLIMNFMFFFFQVFLILKDACNQTMTVGCQFLHITRHLAFPVICEVFFLFLLIFQQDKFISKKLLNKNQ